MTIVSFSLLIQTFKFCDEDDYESEKGTNVILAGKRDRFLHSAMGLSDNVVVKETSFQMLEVLSSDWERV